MGVGEWMRGKKWVGDERREARDEGWGNGGWEGKGRLDALLSYRSINT